MHKTNGKSRKNTAPPNLSLPKTQAMIPGKSSHREAESGHFPKARSCSCISFPPSNRQSLENLAAKAAELYELLVALRRQAATRLDQACKLSVYAPDEDSLTEYKKVSSQLKALTPLVSNIYEFVHKYEGVAKATAKIAKNEVEYISNQRITFSLPKITKCINQARAHASNLAAATKFLDDIHSEDRNSAITLKNDEGPFPTNSFEKQAKKELFSMFADWNGARATEEQEFHLYSNVSWETVELLPITIRNNARLDDQSESLEDI